MQVIESRHSPAVTIEHTQPVLQNEVTRLRQALVDRGLGDRLGVTQSNQSELTEDRIEAAAGSRLFVEELG